MSICSQLTQLLTQLFPINSNTYSVITSKERGEFRNLDRIKCQIGYKYLK